MNILLGHLFIFSLGIALPDLISRYKTTFTSRIICLISFVLFLFFVWSTRRSVRLFYSDKSSLGPFFVISLFAFCYYMIKTTPPLPFKRMLVLLGNYSYSIYLFHLLFYKIIYKFGVIKYGSLQSIIFTLLLFPIFFLTCVILENGSVKLLRFLNVNRYSKIKS